MREINQKAPVKAEKKILIEAKIETVWKVLTNIDEWKNWNTEITQSHLNGELKVGQTFDWKIAGSKLHSTIHTFEPLEKLGWTGKVFGVFAIHNWYLKEENGKTEVRVEESMEGFLTRLLPKMFQKSLEIGMQNWLEQMKKVCEEKQRVFEQ